MLMFLLQIRKTLNLLELSRALIVFPEIARDINFHYFSVFRKKKKFSAESFEVVAGGMI